MSECWRLTSYLLISAISSSIRPCPGALLLDSSPCSALDTADDNRDEMEEARRIGARGIKPLLKDGDLGFMAKDELAWSRTWGLRGVVAKGDGQMCRNRIEVKQVLVWMLRWEVRRCLVKTETAQG
jgi:hypothetical protein